MLGFVIRGGLGVTAQPGGVTTGNLITTDALVSLTDDSDNPLLTSS